MRRILIKLLHPLAFRGVGCNLRVFCKLFMAFAHSEENSNFHNWKQPRSRVWVWVCVCVGCRRKVGNTQCSNSWGQTTTKCFRILGPKFPWHLAALIPCRGRPFGWQPVVAPLPWLAFYRVLHVWHKMQLCKWVAAILRIQFAMHSCVHTALHIFISIRTIW